MMPEVQTDRSSSSKSLPSHAKVVVIGGGVVGCSILFHLANFGWKDVVLLEGDELTSGSSWHAAGQIHTISSDPNISRMQSYTIDLYKEIEETSGQAILKVGVAIGYVSSGGYGHRVGKSMAMGYVLTEHVVEGAVVQVEILGEVYDKEILGAPAYDPTGAQMRLA